MTEFKVGDRVRFFQDLSEYYGVGSPQFVDVGSVGEVVCISNNHRPVQVEFEDELEETFYENELQLVDEETDLPFVPQFIYKTVLDTSLDINLDVYLAALSNMTTARKQMADLSLDRYLPEAVRESLEKRLDSKIQESGKQAEEAIARMSKILEVE